MTKRKLTFALSLTTLSLSLLSSPFLSASKLSDQDIAKADYKKLLTQLTPLEGTTPTQWRVSWSGDTSTTATVSWSTALAGKKHTLHYGTKPSGTDPQNFTHHLDAQKNGAYSINANEAKSTSTAFYHHCVLKDLKPKTKYYFTLESDGKFSRPLYFITSPESGDFKMIAGGDSRTGLADRARMNLRMAATFMAHPDIYAFCHGGDYINSGASWRQWRLWLSHHELTTLDDGRVLPVIHTKGNHDSGILFFEIFNLESNTTKSSYWHNTQLTKHVNIITLDTNYTAKGPQEKWLKEQLTSLRPESRYLLTNYHRPLFPAVKSIPSQAAVFVPLFEQFNVDLALESDGHCIKRTAPIRNGKIDPTGVTYIGEGGLGVGQRQPKKDLWYLKDGYVGRGHHIYLLHFTQSSLKVDTVLLDGKIEDTFELKPREK